MTTNKKKKLRYPIWLVPKDRTMLYSYAIHGPELVNAYCNGNHKIFLHLGEKFLHDDVVNKVKHFFDEQGNLRSSWEQVSREQFIAFVYEGKEPLSATKSVVKSEEQNF